MRERPWWREWGGLPRWLDPDPKDLRFRPLVGDDVWFGPRPWGGWGWTPVSAKGWLVLAAHVVAVVLAVSVLSEPVAFGITLLLTASMIGVCVAKGTSPGGPSAWRHFKALREQSHS